MALEPHSVGVMLKHLVLPRFAFVSIALLSGCVDSDDTGPGGSGGGGGDEGSGIIDVHHGATTYGATSAFAGTTNGASSGCIVESFGDCAATMCPTTGGGNVVQLLDAGTVTAAGPTVGPLTLMKLGGFYTANGNGRLAGPAERVTFRTSGGDLPALALDVTVPAQIAVSAPVFAAMSIPVVERAAGLTVSWSGGASGELVAVSITQADRGLFVTCRFDAATGTARVEPAALDLLEPGYGSVTVQSVREQIYDVDGWRITTTGAEDAGGAPFAMIQ